MLEHISPPLGRYTSPLHRVEVYVGDRKSLLIDARPRFDLGDGVWRSFPFWSREFGAYESTTKKPVPIFSVNLLLMSFVRILRR